MNRFAITLACALLLAAGCGLPNSQTADRVPAGDVPYGLLDDDPSVSASGAPSSSPSAHLYWLREDGRLQPVAAPPLGPGTRAGLAYLFDALAAGPDEAEQSAGLGTALGTGVNVELVSLTAGIAEVQVDFDAQEPSPDRLPAAIGQLVLTAVSTPMVTSVQIVQDGEIVSVPLPSGALSDGPLTAAEYASLVARL